MKDRIETVRSEFLQAKEGLLKALANTPDERLNWSPSPTSRSPLHQAAHAAHAIASIQGFLDGRPFTVPTPEEADRGFRAWEQTLEGRAEVVGMLESNAGAFVAWLDALTPEKFGATVTTPFGMGDVPVAVAIGFPADHTRWHHAQLDYIQTVYGDQDWHT